MPVWGLHLSLALVAPPVHQEGESLCHLWQSHGGPEPASPTPAWAGVPKGPGTGDLGRGHRVARGAVSVVSIAKDSRLLQEQCASRLFLLLSAPCSDDRLTFPGVSFIPAVGSGALTGSAWCVRSEVARIRSFLRDDENKPRAGICHAASSALRESERTDFAQGIGACQWR